MYGKSYANSLENDILMDLILMITNKIFTEAQIKSLRKPLFTFWPPGPPLLAKLTSTWPAEEEFPIIQWIKDTKWSEIHI